ncbi:MFS transporter [Caldovatus sediminis]|uniref:MFS transporter n=1 Tax=Caldovatus sediminis TaxID=2041189 RepID=A0A8J2ZA05_9PROT|nr:tripartite tricarboxylate transporter substrate binding protein [Caldovatus sediminis]GGG26868.1 MFS transporter [Caldovatus sediminis]
MNRRGLLRSGLALAAAPIPARAQDWPSRPIRLIVPFPPGGPNDIIARLYGPQLSALLGQPVVVENRTGAGGVVGTDAAVRAQPDGHTLAVTNGGSLVISPYVSSNVPYRVPDDFTLISVVTRVPEALVANPRVGVRTLPELLELVRREPGKLNIGTAGAAGLSHLAAELFKVQTGADVVVVPYRGAAPSVTDLIAGQIQLLFADLPVLMPHIRGGTLTPLAMASARRSPSLPDLPTTGEFGYPELLAENWYCLVGPAGLPRPVVARLSEAVRKAAETREVREGLASQGAEATWTSPEEFAAFVRSEAQKWRTIAERSGVRTD